MSKSKKKLGKNAKQQEIPLKGKGVEALHIQAIEDAADEYVKARDERITLSETEDDAKKALMQVVLLNRDRLIQEVGGGVSYRYGDRLVTLVPTKETIKVNSVHDESVEVSSD